MIESFMIMLIGGGIGILGSWGILTILSSPGLAGMQKVMGKPSIDITIALTTAGILALIGFAAGWSPAKAASQMDPVRALEF
jgi:ABC-type antimicrobial peptide transport system permease subunit